LIGPQTLPHLENLFEAEVLPSFGLSPALHEHYGSDLGFATPVVYANFVETIDGVVAFGDGTPPSVLSGKSEADRLVMGLLRACAGAIVIGAGTLRQEQKHLWTPEYIFPALAEDYGRLRVALGLAPVPKLVVLTRSGQIATNAAALAGATVFTTTPGAERLRPSLREDTIIKPIDSNRIDPVDVVDALRRDGHQSILTEGGPHVLGSFLRGGVLDELFLTLSPRIAGRTPGEHRLGLVEDFSLEPDGLIPLRLLTAKRHESHLFLRYAFDHHRGPAGPGNHGVE
jgi:riboflavin biosynthesis pyrimidine reductase